LASARVIDENHLHADVIQVGSHVVVQEEGSTTEEEYVIVGAAEADPRQGRISNVSPLGKALIDHRAGDVVHVDAPAGAFTVRIVKVK